MVDVLLDRDMLLFIELWFVTAAGIGSGGGGGGGGTMLDRGSGCGAILDCSSLIVSACALTVSFSSLIWASHITSRLSASFSLRWVMLASLTLWKQLPVTARTTARVAYLFEKLDVAADGEEQVENALAKQQLERPLYRVQDDATQHQAHACHCSGD